MSTKRSVGHLAGAILASLVSAMQLGCGSTAHDFVKAHTGIDVGPEVRLCSSGILHDDRSCMPNGTGGTPWVRNENFDIFSINKDPRLGGALVEERQGGAGDIPTAPFAAPNDDEHGERDDADEQGVAILYAVNKRYLGTPYWGGHIQPECRKDISTQRAISPAWEIINLAADLDDEINRRFVVDAIASLRGEGIAIDARGEAAFRAQLHSIVEQKIRVELVWFVTSYTGGRDAIVANRAFSRCSRVVEAHEDDGAQFVTGVAGFVVIANHADVSINSAEAVAEAIHAAFGRSTPVVDAKIASAWERTVGNVIHVEASTDVRSQTVYPLWVQFE
jgi:hypothetical protein